MADQQPPQDQGQQPPMDQGQQPPQQGGQPAGEKEDYLDKGLDAVEKKFGGKYGMGDPQKMRGTNEKITDGARGFFEKVTGKKVPEKFSN